MSEHLYASRSCQIRFCTVVAGFTDRHVFVTGSGPASPVVGWCDACHRRVCSQCALRLPLSGSEAEAQLVCLHCGEPLGLGGRLTVQGQLVGNDTPHPIPEAYWLNLLRALVLAGAFSTEGLSRAREAVAVGDTRSALRLFRNERLLCEAGGHFVGATTCEVEEGLQLLGESSSASRGLELLIRAEEHMKGHVDARFQLRYWAGYLYALVHTKAEPKTRCRVAKKLEHAAREQGSERLVRFAIDATVEALLELGHFSDMVFELRRLPGGDAIVEKMGLSDRYPIRRDGVLPWKTQDITRIVEAGLDVWACPKGCNASVLAGLPKTADGSRLPCLLCGSSFVCLNAYAS